MQRSYGTTKDSLLADYKALLEGWFATFAICRGLNGFSDLGQTNTLPKESMNLPGNLPSPKPCVCGGARV